MDEYHKQMIHQMRSAVVGTAGPYNGALMTNQRIYNPIHYQLTTSHHHSHPPYHTSPLFTPLPYSLHLAAFHDRDTINTIIYKRSSHTYS